MGISKDFRTTAGVRAVPRFAAPSRRVRARSRGQSLVELAIVAPVLILILLVAIDFGRGFYSWVILQNAARIGANYAGLNAQGWKTNPDDAAITAEYELRIEEDVDRALCDAPGTPPAPVFTDSPADTSSGGQTPDTSYDVGDSVKVSLNCVFHPLTPVISAILSSNIDLGASSEFRIRAGDIAGLDNAPAIPAPSAATPTPTATPTTGPTPTCGPPTADFNPVANQSGRSPLQVTFTDTSTATSGCPITDWAWIFQGATPATATGAGPHTVTFTKPPTQHDVSLTVTSAGGSDTLTRNHHVRTN